MAPVKQPELPSGMSAADFVDLTKQLAAIRAEVIYVGAGSYTESELSTLFADKSVLTTELSTNLVKLGLLNEKAFKHDSKVEKVKTKHHVFETNRANTVEVTIDGMSEDKKDFFEAISRDGTQLTLVALTKQNDKGIIINGCTWTVDWSGEDRGLITIVIGTEFSGSTKNVVVIKHNIPDAA